jgi:hypothetical protein
VQWRSLLKSKHKFQFGLKSGEKTGILHKDLRTFITTLVKGVTMATLTVIDDNKQSPTMTDLHEA